MGSNPLLIVIAAGGDGRRMGGNKPARLINGQRLIDRMVDWARRYSSNIALAVRPGDSDWDTGLPVLVDSYKDIGPISALSSAMEEARRQQQETVLLIGCDLPFLPDTLIPRLTDALGQHAAAVPSTNGKVHPMAALWRTDPVRLNGWIAQGGRSMWRFAQEAGMVDVAWPDSPDPFANINDADALAAAQARIKTLGC